MRTIAVCNLKGGVGKTTTTVNLGASLARNRKRVLLVDCDPQGNLTNWMRARPAQDGPTLYEILRGQATVRSAAIPTRWDNLYVVPSSPRLHEIDRGALAGERVLWARMSDEYDYALLDCSAAPGVVLTNALTAAQEVLAPVQAKGMALSGVERLQQLIDDVASRSNSDAELTGILVCLFDGRTRISRLVLGQLRAKYANLVYDTVVHENVKLSEAADRRRPINRHAPTSRGAAEYAAIAFELMARQHARDGGSVAHLFNFPPVPPQPTVRPAPLKPAPVRSTVSTFAVPQASGLLVPQASGVSAGAAPSQDAAATPARAHHVAPPGSLLGQD